LVLCLFVVPLAKQAAGDEIAFAKGVGLDSKFFFAEKIYRPTLPNYGGLSPSLLVFPAVFDLLHLSLSIHVSRARVG